MLKDSNGFTTTSMQNQQDGVLPSTTNNIKIQDQNVEMEAGQFAKKLFRALFCSHLFLIAILVIVLTIRGLLSAENRHFYPKKWYPPLLAATACAALVSFTWQWVVRRKPTKVVKLVFWFSPLLTCGVGILLVLISSGTSAAIGAIAVVSAVLQSLYGCWVNHRFVYAAKVLSVSISFPPLKTARLVFTSIVASVVYSAFLATGIGGATSTATRLDVIFILLILLSFLWTMQVIKNIQQVAFGRARYVNFTSGTNIDTGLAVRDTIKYLMGSVCIGSFLVPVIVVIRGSARTVKLIAGGTDEFLFSCANCYSGIAKTLVTYGNRWAFVQVGVESKGFVQASTDAWETFRRVGYEQLIDTDLTGSFCFLSGVTCGGICGLVGGTWTLVIQESYATEITIYAFLIGYFTCRIAMAWVQACVSAYYVSCAENSNTQIDSIIPDRLQELQRYNV